jgi:hypothetical protein
VEPVAEAHGAGTLLRGRGRIVGVRRAAAVAAVAIGSVAAEPTAPSARFVCGESEGEEVVQKSSYQRKV